MRAMPGSSFSDRAGTARPAQSFLFLQGPISPFFRRLGRALAARGHAVLRVNLCAGDWVFWHGPDSTSYRGELAGWGAHVGALMDRRAVTDLVLLGEQRPYHVAAIAEARRRGITVTVTDYGYLRPDWITLEHDGMSAQSHLPRTPEGIRAVAADAPPPDLTPRFGDSFAAQARWDVAYHLLSSLLWVLYPGYRSHQIHHPVLNYLGTGLRLLRRRRMAARAAAKLAELRAAGTSYWVFAMQMEVDYSIRAYSPFDDMTMPLRQTIGSFARAAPADAVLVVKLHPLDPGLRPWPRLIRQLATTAGAAGRVRFVDGGSLEDMLASARGLVTVNSTVGVWAIRQGVRLCVLGHALYDIPGLTFQGGLDRFWAEAAPPDPALAADFIRAISDTIHIRGVYYADPGLAEAVTAAAARLDAAASQAMAARMVRAGGGAACAPLVPAARPRATGPGQRDRRALPVPAFDANPQKL
jgi:capsular polysaccharide export protein